MTPILLTTRLTGRIGPEEARAWQHDLQQQVAATPPGATIRLLVDQTGYQPASLDAHRVVRTVLPQLLADCGLAPALADLIGEPGPAVETRPARRILACALVHHEEFKMAELDRAVGRPDQRFFSDRDAALEWLRSAP